MSRHQSGRGVRFGAKLNGQYPNSCCQTCGIYLAIECYAQSEATRVPRKNKICKECYEDLPSFLQERYHRYEYGKYEPRGAGWNAEKTDRPHR